MTQDNKYCPQILQQILAASSALKVLKMEILKRYLTESREMSKRSGNLKFNGQILEIVKIQMRN